MPASTTGRGGILLLLLCVSSHYITLWMLRGPSHQWEQCQRNSYDCGVWLMADAHAIYSSLSAVPMELDIDKFHTDVCQKILGLPNEGNVSKPTFTLLEKDKYKVIRERAESACQQYPIDDAIYCTNPLPCPTLSNLMHIKCMNIDD